MDGSLVCQTVAGGTNAELLARRDAAELAAARNRGTAPDMVELRLDGVIDPDVRSLLAGHRLPTIVTCRPVWEGGRFAGSEGDRRRLLEQALDAGADYVDVEWRAGWRDLVGRRNGRGVIVSLHDFNGIPDDLPALYAAMCESGAQVVKIAVTARHLSDVFALDACRRAAAPGRQRGPHAETAPVSGPPGSDLPDSPTPAAPDVVFIAMGPAGVATRVLPARFGSRWTYAGAEAPGQMSSRRLLTEFRVRDLTAATAVYGVVGTHTSRSLSPSLHNPAFARAGVDAVFLPLQTDDFDDFLAFAERLPLAGASVTMPFKETAMRRAAVCDEIARRAGAVNTLRRDPSGWHATNTDIEGFLDPIRDVDLRGRRAAILGAGGAARAVAVALAHAQAKVAVFARRRDRAEAVAALAGGRAYVGLPETGSWDLLVNATPVGSAPDVDETPIEADRLSGGMVYDLVYLPRETRLVREARQAGCRAIGGFDMLVAQAKRQRQWWGLHSGQGR